jgi:hypothetical protein
MSHNEEHCIDHTIHFKMPLIFDYKPCQAPYYTKKSKNTSGGREAQMWCVLKGEHLPSSYTTSMVSLEIK